MASLQVKVDTGASGNVLLLYLFRHLYPDHIDKTGHQTGLNVSNTRLTAYNGTQIPLFGSLHGPITPPDKLLLVGGRHPWSLGSHHVRDWKSFKRTVLSMSSKILPGCLVPLQHHQHPHKTAPIRSTEDLIKKFPDGFQGIGQFPGEYTIKLCDNAQPVIHGLLKCIISIHPRVKAEWDKMAKLGVIALVDEPTDWISSVAYAWKASGELHICLDSHDLNNAICRDHHCTPKVDEVSHEFAHFKYFMKLDARHGYWAIVLDSKSSLLTTFNTPYGQYHFLHLPFGIACSQDGFQKRMHQILEECEGCIGIADDITIHGYTESECDACLWKLIEVAWKFGFSVQPWESKCQDPNGEILQVPLYESGVHLIQRRLMLYMPCLHQLTSQSFRCSLAW